MPQTGKKARLAIAAVLAGTASPEPSPQKAKKGKQWSAPTPVEVDDSRDDSPARPSLYLLLCKITTLTYASQGFYVKIVVLRSSRDRESIEKWSSLSGIVRVRIE